MSFSAQIIAFFWVVFVLDEVKEKKLFLAKFKITTIQHNQHSNESLEEISKIKNISHSNSNEIIDETSMETIGTKSPLKLLFDFDNVTQMIKTCIKKRNYKVRQQIWLLFLVLFTYLFVFIGPLSIIYQFSQKVYLWNAETYSYAASIGQVIETTILILVAPFLVKVKFYENCF